MKVSDINNVKIYNLSAGKSLPEWLSERKRRSLLKKNYEYQSGITLLQDFDMPGLSTTIRLSPDGQYILATGIYKPRVKCFDVNNHSLKFERCFDSEVVTFEIISEDYSKLVFLQCDRYVEIHAGHGRHYRLRIPRFGRDLSYHKPSCDTFIVGASSDIYRLNLERGQFLQPFTTQASSINRSAINPEHHLLVVGTADGTVEAWDPRSKERAATLNLPVGTDKDGKKCLPTITSLTFKNGLTMGVGTQYGNVLLYDVRSPNPYLVKDHLNCLPIRDVCFHRDMDYVYSMDTNALKIWDSTNGSTYATIESTADLNSLCVVPGSGMMFLATENTKMLTYYIPSLGPAPRWCACVDNAIDEIDSEKAQVIYDDYKFVTVEELNALGLDHLIGTNLLRAYMHGYFLDARLYAKAKSVANPFEFAEYRKRKIREKIEESRPSRLQIDDKLPKVNKELAMKLIERKNSLTTKKKNQASSDLLQDSRFSAIFENPEFEVDKNTAEYRLLNPVLSNLDKSKAKALAKSIKNSQFESVDDVEDKESDEDDLLLDSSDDEHQWTKEVKREHKKLKYEADKRRAEEKLADAEELAKEPKFFELKAGEEYRGLKNIKRKINKTSLGERIALETPKIKMLGSVGRREMTFSTKKEPKDRKAMELMKKHREERMKVRRSATGVQKKINYFGK